MTVVGGACPSQCRLRYYRRPVPAMLSINPELRKVTRAGVCEICSYASLMHHAVPTDKAAPLDLFRGDLLESAGSGVLILARVPNSDAMRADTLSRHALSCSAQPGHRWPAPQPPAGARLRRTIPILRGRGQSHVWFCLLGPGVIRIGTAVW
jgi:hypothetical protein